MLMKYVNLLLVALVMLKSQSMNVKPLAISVSQMANTV